MDISQQLYSGIRYFDVRVAADPSTGVLCVYHSDPASVGYNQGPFSDVVNAFNSFLASHPSEVALCQIKQESTTDGTVFLQTLQSTLRPQPRWVFDMKLTTMGNLRGKVQVIYRGGTTPTSRLGIDFSAYPNNAQSESFQPADSAMTVWVEDYYDISGLPMYAWIGKWNTVKSMLQKVQASSINPTDPNFNTNRSTLFITYTSYAAQPTIDPEDAALGTRGSDITPMNVPSMNSGLRTYLMTQVPATARLDVIMMDFPDATMGDDLIETIIQKNNFAMTT